MAHGTLFSSTSINATMIIIVNSNEDDVHDHDDKANDDHDVRYDDVDDGDDHIETYGEYTCGGQKFTVTDGMLISFKELGYFLVRSLLSPEEITKIKTAVEHERFLQHAFWVDNPDTGLRESRKVMWRHPGSDVTGMLLRSEKFAGTCEKILEGSHRCGRIDHSHEAGYTGANLTRVEQIKGLCRHKYVEMSPGDALFFHCNLLHTSGTNVSDTKRWALIPCYNLRSNNPIYEHHHPQYTPLHKVPDTAIMDCHNFDDLSGKQFNIPGEDKTAS
ncbi:phytanoyl-coa dioxygenase domain-containing protein 1 homolog [Plakobranchus ocellatus]|uniref:Phytanoyl-coa dioxygenase domain-containing protein 1 homolog n=1 Tax=Plakobranchus ocellatus TaxID=259542 RepID=A0AAV3Z0N5_9GAST|nr:phytanoyl-coa dioxygenase domain-containing protein 1 homolog [Plakobranchus ocellatus]